jgi:hypothetical protein
MHEFSEFCTLNTLGNCMVFFNCFVRYVANLYPGLFLQLTIGLIGILLCVIYGAVYMWCFWVHVSVSPFSVCLIVFLHSLIAVLMAFCCFLV